jgi:hypothetical protein
MLNIKHWVLALPLLLSACYVQSDVQSEYVDQQSECQGLAEDKMGDEENLDALSVKQRNALLVDHFSTCMISRGWHVARPVKKPLVPTPPGTTRNPREAALPAQPLPGQPSNVITARQPAPTNVPAQSSPPNYPVRTQPSVLQPSGNTPALSQPATQQAPATYQPVQGYGASGNPGRQF